MSKNILLIKRGCKRRGEREVFKMILVGMYSTTIANGTTTTLQGKEEFDAYYSNLETGRKCIGKKVN